jgi:hypothetical protein
MAERINRCAADDCGAQTVVPDGDWETVQRPFLERWESQHEAEAHDGETMAYTLSPAPMFDRER